MSQGRRFSIRTQKTAIMWLAFRFPDSPAFATQKTYEYYDTVVCCTYELDMSTVDFIML